ncbi:hypothetical protein [Pedobacter sp. NJ-S-72]
MDTANLSRTVKRNMYSWHRILGIMTIIPVIFWTCSGLSHPIIAHWFKLQIAHEYIKPAAIDNGQVKLSVNQVLSKNGVNLFRNFRLIGFRGKTFYQVKDRKNEIQYFSAEDGVKLPDGDRLYAEYLSRYFLGDSTSKVVSITPVTTFTDEYKYINRLLPVWKVSFDRKDKMDVYVETSQSRLANYNDTNRRSFFSGYSVISIVMNSSQRSQIIQRGIPWF